jgi:hypothetical protein
MRQTTIFDLPAEALGEIFTQYDNPAIWETCRTFATVAFSTTSLWTTVYISPHQFTTDGPDILRERISRARGRLLDVLMWLTTESEDTAEVSALCKVFSEFNAQIRCFKLTAITPTISGAVAPDIFPKSEAMPALEVLSVLSEQGIEDLCESASWPQLSLVLVNASTMFPNLRKLHMNIFHDVVPRLPSSASFSHLTKLILDGSLEQSSPRPSLIAALLHCTPQLESLWMKHHYYDTNKWGTVKGRSISKNIQLPKLKHLAVSTPGTAWDLMGCIAAPALEDLHLDGSRGPMYEDPPKSIDWNDWVLELGYNMLKLFASRCQNVRRFAITQAYLSRSAWDWLLFGEDERDPPFPKLECIALHGVYEYVQPNTWSGFDHLLMEKFACNPKIPLKRLALLYCYFPLRASVLVDVFRASGAKVLECDEYIPQWEGGEREQFDELGVSLTRHESEVDEDEWWTLGHEIDATDSKAY